ncbi:MAG: 4-hydroxy-3-methylbut-2-enyl diphosphate reductase [Bacteroidales bacterium]
MERQTPTKLHLKVSIGPGSGFCSGVTKAVQLAEEILDRGEEVYCVGKIVHNDDEIERLGRKGLRVINLSELQHLSGKNVLFRAHGEPPSSYLLALQNGNTLIDASCSIVLRIQDKIRRACEKGETVVIYGKKDHPEVKGLVGQGKDDIIVLESLSDLDDIHLPGEISLFSQTTKSHSGFYELAAALEKRGVIVNLNDTVCRQVYKREDELGDFSKTQDVMLFVAGKESSNGKVLFGICSQANANSHYISRISEINTAWFSIHQKVGLAGATSTPLWLLEEVKAWLEKL